MVSNERGERWKIFVKKKRVSLWKVLEVVGKDKNGGNWYKLFI